MAAAAAEETKAGAESPTAGGAGGGDGHGPPHHEMVTVTEEALPRMVVDLDAEPERRWDAVIDAFRDRIPGALGMIDSIITGATATVATGFMSMLTKMGGVMYGRELRGISERLGVDLGSVALLQIAYEAFAHCTSIVVDGPDGTPIHFRTMDWGDADRTTLGGGMPELKAITVMIDFQRDGKTVYSATTWAGYVGVLTGMRHGGWSVSVNFRVTEDWGSLKGFLKNAWAGVTSSWPVGFLNRYVLESTPDYSSAVAALAASALMAPVYLTVAGAERGEGCAIARGRSGEAGERQRLEDGPVVQTNIDHWMIGEPGAIDIEESIERSALSRAFIAEKTADGDAMTLDDLWTLGHIRPVLAVDNVYTVSMIPKISHSLGRVEHDDALLGAAAPRAPEFTRSTSEQRPVRRRGEL